MEPNKEEVWAHYTYICAKCGHIVGMFSNEDGTWWIPKDEKCKECGTDIWWGDIGE